MIVTEDESQYLAKCTRLQAQSSIWFEHRKARLTASRFRAICHTSVEKPAESLVKQILQKAPLPKCAPLTWGMENEVNARNQYKKMMGNTHNSFEVQTTGLHVNPKYPHLGASPDGLTTCTCCGDGLLEIKCPYIVYGTPFLSPHWDELSFFHHKAH